MRLTLRTVALVLVLLALLAPLTTWASDGPCPDDPEGSKDCAKETPPYYVVINRSVELLYPTRPGTGCQPIILNNPDCKDCTGSDCDSIDIEDKVCQHLPKPTGTAKTVVFEMCCNCASNSDGAWIFRIRVLQEDGTCPVDPENPRWIEGLPPSTGIDLPVPVVVGGLALMGAGLLAAGALVRRRATQSL